MSNTLNVEANGDGWCHRGPRGKSETAHLGGALMNSSSFFLFLIYMNISLSLIRLCFRKFTGRL